MLKASDIERARDLVAQHEILNAHQRNLVALFETLTEKPPAPEFMRIEASAYGQHGALLSDVTFDVRFPGSMRAIVEVLSRVVASEIAAVATNLEALGVALDDGTEPSAIVED